MRKLIVSCICVLLCLSFITHLSNFSIFGENIEALTESPETNNTIVYGMNTFAYEIEIYHDNVVPTVVSTIATIFGAAISIPTGGIIGTTITIMGVTSIMGDLIHSANHPKREWINCCGPSGIACDLSQNGIDNNKCSYYGVGMYKK